MKILHVVNISFVIPYYLGEQINYFDSLGYEIHIACSPDSNAESYSLIWNFKLIDVLIRRDFSPIDDFKAIFRLTKYIVHNDIDVVIGHTPKGALIGMVSAYLARVQKRIYFRHGLMYETSRGIKRVILKNIERLTSFLASKVVCVSASVLNKSISDKISIKKKLTILNKGTCNGIDAIGKFNPQNVNKQQIDKILEQLNLDKKECLVFGFLGRLAKDKGINELVEAWEIIKQKYEKVVLLIVGPIDERDGIDNHLYNKVINDSSIIISGSVNNAECYYSLMDVFILPSYREGFPTVVLEASAMELPVITTRSTGCVDSIIENTTGLFTKIDGKSIADSISIYIDNPDLRKLHGKIGRQMVLDNFSQKIIWEKLKKMIDK